MMWDLEGNKHENFADDIDALSCYSGSTKAGNVDSPNFDLDSVVSDSESESVILLTDSEHASEQVSKKRKAGQIDIQLPTSKKMTHPKDSMCGGSKVVAAQGQGFK